jgi:Protein of unknown function (DUF3592)
MLTGSALTWTYVATAISLIAWANLVFTIWRGRNQVAAGKIWARTAAEIIESEVEVAGSHCSDEVPDCAPRVRYRYSVAGKTYEGDRIRFGSRSDTTRMLAERIIAKYPTGCVVEILYDPKHPSNATLEGQSANAPANYALLIVFSVISALLVSQSIAGKVLTAAGVPYFVFLLPLAAIALAVTFISYLKLRSTVA